MLANPQQPWSTDRPDAAFGHGTMVSGIIHIVAPSAYILPLKAFRSDGTGYLSGILRALYVAGSSHVQVTNMSFDLPSYSRELNTAIQFLNSLGVVCVAAAGNDGRQILVYPAALDGLVIGVASTTNRDRRSSFSNYGPNLVWIAAPGEGIVTTYPFATFAAGWGTSFSAPLASGTAALLFQMSALSNETAASQVVAHAVPLGSDLGNGRMDIVQALQAWRQSRGIP
jgi:thermitase